MKKIIFSILLTLLLSTQLHAIEIGSVGGAFDTTAATAWLEAGDFTPTGDWDFTGATGYISLAAIDEIVIRASSSSIPDGTVLTNNWLTSSGDPKFANPDITDPTSSTLPNLSLQDSSTAINGGTYLTQANGSGSNSTALIVDDALFFQDGTWGFDLARGVTLFPDWIAIGTVDNTVQISSVNYDTNTITLASARTWADDANIWLYKKSDGEQVLYGSAPDYGAYEWHPSHNMQLGSGPTVQIDASAPTWSFYQ